MENRRKQWLIIIGLIVGGAILVGGIYLLGQHLDKQSELPPSQQEILKKGNQDKEEIEYRMTSPEVTSSDSQALHEFNEIVKKCSWSEEQAKNFKRILKNEFSQHTKLVFHPDSVNYSTELVAEAGVVLCDFAFSIDNNTYEVFTDYQSAYDLMVSIKKGEEMIYSSPYS